MYNFAVLAHLISHYLGSSMFLSHLVTKIRKRTKKFYKDKTMKRNIGRVVPVIPTHSKDYGQDNRSMSILEQKALMRQWRIAAAKGKLL